MKRIKKFEENYESYKMDHPFVDDFDILKKELIENIDQVLEIYDDFINDFSPKHWRTTGHHFTELKKMKEEVKNFTPITSDELKIDWVRKERFNKK